MIPGGERPPVVFDNCADVISTAELSAIVGGSVVAIEGSDENSSGANLGATFCYWRLNDENPEAQDGYFWIVPISELGDTPVEDYVDMATDYCPYLECAGIAAGSTYLVASQAAQRVADDGYFDEEGEAAAHQIAGAVAASVLDHIDATPVPWVRDRSLWLASLNCADLAAELEPFVGSDAEVFDYLYEDPPRLFALVADQASQASGCQISSPAGSFAPVHISSQPGEAWNVPGEPEGYWSAATDPDVAGIAAYVSEGGHSAILSDGVNRVSVSALGGAEGLDMREIYRAVAESFAQGFAEPPA